MGIVCHAQCAVVHNGNCARYCGANVCRPGTSDVNAQTPLPTVSAENGSILPTFGLLACTSDLRSMSCVGFVDPAARIHLEPRSDPPASPVPAMRMFRRVIFKLIFTEASLCY